MRYCCLLDVIEMSLNKTIIQIEHDLQERNSNLNLYLFVRLSGPILHCCYSPFVSLEHIVIKTILDAVMNLLDQLLRLLFF